MGTDCTGERRRGAQVWTRAAFVFVPVREPRRGKAFTRGDGVGRWPFDSRVTRARSGHPFDSACRAELQVDGHSLRSGVRWPAMSEARRAESNGGGGGIRTRV